MVTELRTFTGESQIEKIYSGFNFWFNEHDTAQRSIWKENMLVLLTLYPVVFLLSYIQNPLMQHGAPFWLALFVSNLVSTLILGYITVPWLMKKFEWWLKSNKIIATLVGTGMVITLYVFSLWICWVLTRVNTYISQ